MRGSQVAALPLTFSSIGQLLESETGVRFAAEYDDCKRAAKRAGAPLGEVVAAAEGAARDADDGEAGRVR